MHDWRDVILRTTRLGECLDAFPNDPEPPVHVVLERRLPEEIRTEARARFLAMPVEASCCLFGSLVLLHNPEPGGTIEDRAKHLTHSEDNHRSHIDTDKCRWLPAILDTLSKAAAVLEDTSNGTLVFVRKHSGWNLHFVIVQPLHGRYTKFVRGQVCSRLITQFSHAPNGRQEALRIFWKRTK